MYLISAVGTSNLPKFPRLFGPILLVQEMRAIYLKKVPDVLILELERVYFGAFEMGNIKFYQWWVWPVLVILHSSAPSAVM